MRIAEGWSQIGSAFDFPNLSVREALRLLTDGTEEPSELELAQDDATVEELEQDEIPATNGAPPQRLSLSEILKGRAAEIGVAHEQHKHEPPPLWDGVVEEVETRYCVCCRSMTAVELRDGVKVCKECGAGPATVAELDREIRRLGKVAKRQKGRERALKVFDKLDRICDRYCNGYGRCREAFFTLAKVKMCIQQGRESIEGASREN